MIAARRRTGAAARPRAHAGGAAHMLAARLTCGAGPDVTANHKYDSSGRRPWPAAGGRSCHTWPASGVALLGVNQPARAAHGASSGSPKCARGPVSTGIGRLGYGTAGGESRAAPSSARAAGGAAKVATAASAASGGRARDRRNRGKGGTCCRPEECPVAHFEII